MLDRVIIVGALLIIGFGLFLWFQYRQKGRITQLDNSDKVLNQLMKGKPAIIYFSMHNCIPCHTQQRPALNKLESQLGDKVQIIEVNTTENPDIAQNGACFLRRRLSSSMVMAKRNTSIMAQLPPIN